MLAPPEHAQEQQQQQQPAGEGCLPLKLNRTHIVAALGLLARLVKPKRRAGAGGDLGGLGPGVGGQWRQRSGPECAPAPHDVPDRPTPMDSDPESAGGGACLAAPRYGSMAELAAALADLALTTFLPYMSAREISNVTWALARAAGGGLHERVRQYLLGAAVLLHRKGARPPPSFQPAIGGGRMTPCAWLPEPVPAHRLHAPWAGRVRSDLSAASHHRTKCTTLGNATGQTNSRIHPRHSPCRSLN